MKSRGSRARTGCRAAACSRSRACAIDGGEDKRLVALEVVVSSPLLDKLEVYRGLGVREVWVYRSGRFTIHALREGAYIVIASSEVFPEVDLEQLARHVAMPDQHAALVAFRDELRAQMK